jgi:hypothetical protein
MDFLANYASTIIVVIVAALAVWRAIVLLEGYGTDYGKKKKGE